MKNIFNILVIVFLTLIITSCKKEKPKPPTISTSTVTEITYATATSGGNVTNEGGASITSRGVCWNTSSYPTTADSLTNDGAGSGHFISSLTNLQPGTIYYVRSYATNSVGTSYGDDISFTTLATVPILTTTAVSSVTAISCNSGGIITSDGGAAITARGVCYGISQNPIASGNYTSDGNGTAEFTSLVFDLTPNTTYYVRAYATNSAGTGYGNEISFVTGPMTVTDVEGNIYNIVRIGNQLWMKENLKTTRYSNGNLIGTTSPATLSYFSPLDPHPFSHGPLKFQWAYDGNESNVVTYGRLYTLDAVNDNRNVCPTGWHVPTDSDWTTLTDYLGGESVAGNKLTESGSVHWKITNTEATNESGFTALPGGSRQLDGTFINIGYWCTWWSSTVIPLTPPSDYIPDPAYCRDLRPAGIIRYVEDGPIGLSVRCLISFKTAKK